MRIYRLHRRPRDASDFGGSLLKPGRWNPEGVPILYCSTTLALACLEILVHLSPRQIPLDYVYSSAEIPPTDHAYFRKSLFDEYVTRSYGRSWVVSKAALAVLVPSVIIPTEWNVLLNPTHADYASVRWDSPEAFAFDSRLLKATPGQL